MKAKVYFLSVMFFAACAIFTSCMKESVEQQDMITGQQPGEVLTRSNGDKTPKPVAYMEVNDVNPLNAGAYCIDTEPFFDVVILFAANIHADADRDPALHFNDNVTQIMADVNKYIRPLQDKGVKVLLGILGDHKGIGVSNLTESQAETFASILAWAVNTYGLDGVDFDDEYSKYGTEGFSSANSTSFSFVINKLRAKLGPDKLITVFDYPPETAPGLYLNTGAVSNIDYAWYCWFGENSFGSTSLSGLPAAKWSPQAILLGETYNAGQLGQIEDNSADAEYYGYGAIMTFNLRTSTDVNPLPVLQRIATGAGFGTVTKCEPDYPKDWAPGPTQTITKYDI